MDNQHLNIQHKNKVAAGSEEQTIFGEFAVDGKEIL
jgi:hypothetical protein